MKEALPRRQLILRGHQGLPMACCDGFADPTPWLRSLWLSSRPRGKDRFVVMEVAQYHYLRECELDAALAQSRADVAAGRFVMESAQQHVDRLALLEADPHHPSLRLHALGGKHQGLHSVSINLSHRIALELLIRDQVIIPVKVGDHDTVY